MTGFYLGCPVWACKEWQASLYTKNSGRDQWLDQYSRVFSTVEGNSTFYGLPDPSTVKRWGRQTNDGFRFVLKFPRELTHERMLIGGDSILDQFLELLKILEGEDRLGPSLLQLPPKFDGQRLAVLEHFLDRLPEGLPLAIEVRHLDYFDSGKIENAFNQMLRERQLNRVLFDSRPLFSQPPSDDIERESQRRKPRSPFRCDATALHPMVRLVGRNELSTIQPWIDEWAQQTAAWISQGRKPYIFTHAPDDSFAPAMAEIFHKTLQQQLPEIGSLSPWPGRVEPKQMELF